MSLKDKIKSNLKSYQRRQMDVKEQEYQEFVETHKSLIECIENAILKESSEGNLEAKINLPEHISFDNDFHNLKKYFSKEDVETYLENSNCFDNKVKTIVMKWELRE